MGKFKNCLEKERIILAKANSLKLKNKQKLEEFGYKVSPETIIKQKTAKIKSGFIKSAQAYNLDGSFYKRYESISDALKDFSESAKSSYKIVECLKSGKLFANKIWKMRRSTHVRILNIMRLEKSKLSYI